MLYAIRRSWETEEAYWFWRLGRWDVSAGLFHGFGLGVTVQQGEWDVTLGPFSIGGVRE
jgi:hypothetical protein